MFANVIRRKNLRDFDNHGKKIRGENIDRATTGIYFNGQIKYHNERKTNQISRSVKK